MANDIELINSLTWGKTKRSLSRLLKKYQLPQIVRVVDSVQRTNAEACVHDGQVLVLHEIDSVRKLIGTDNLGRKITIPLSCPTQGLVQPYKCKYASCKIEDFKVLFPKVQYVRVKSVDSQTGNDDEISLKVGDFLQIKKISRKTKTVHCQNTDTDEYLTIPYTSPVIFTPLLDYQKYKLSEIVTNYGLPARVCFETTHSQVDENSEQTLKGLNQFVFHKEVSEAQLLATTVAGKSETTQCIGLPMDLPIKCVVAKRTTENEASYNNVIESLQAEFNEKNTTKKVTLFQDVHGVKLYDFTSLERPGQSNAAKISPPISPTEPEKKFTEPNIVARTPPPVIPRTRKRSTQPSNMPPTPTTVSPMTKKRFTDPELSSYPIVPKSTLESSFDDSTREAEEGDDLWSDDDDDYLEMGYVGNISEDVDCKKDNSTEHATSTRSGTNSNYTYCYAEVKPRRNLNLNKEAEYCCTEVNTNRKWNYKPKLGEDQIHTDRSSCYEKNEPRWEFNFNPACANPNSITKRNDRPSSTDSNICVIPMARSTRRKFIVCKRNTYENVCWGKQYYENVFTKMKCGSNSKKFETHKELDTVHGECSDDDEYVEVDNPYQNIEKRQKNTLLKTLSNEEMKASMESTKTQLKDEDQQHTVCRQVRFL